MEDVRKFLEGIASRLCWEDDDPDFAVDDYSGSNVDDAYYGGVNSGEVQLARNLLSMLEGK
jgi:hypothetical protein